jgi:hypothetical protein
LKSKRRLRAMKKFTYKFKFTCKLPSEMRSTGDYLLFESNKRLSSDELAEVWHKKLFEDPKGPYSEVHSIKFVSLEEQVTFEINLKLPDLR